MKESNSQNINLMGFTIGILGIIHLIIGVSGVVMITIGVLFVGASYLVDYTEKKYGLQSGIIKNILKPRKNENK